MAEVEASRILPAVRHPEGRGVVGPAYHTVLGEAVGHIAREVVADHIDQAEADHTDLEVGVGRIGQAEVDHIDLEAAVGHIGQVVVDHTGLGVAGRTGLVAVDHTRQADRIDPVGAAGRTDRTVGLPVEEHLGAQVDLLVCTSAARLCYRTRDRRRREGA